MDQEREHIEGLLKQYQHNLQRLQKQAAQFGPQYITTPLANEIEQTQAKIRELQAQLPPPELPLDSIPDPTLALPPDSYMPYRPNPDFVGREKELRQLASLLAAPAVAVVSQVAAATGMGGIGKSQLAVEYAYRYGPYYPGGVFWLSFEEATTVPAQVAAIGGRDENGGLNLALNWYELEPAEQVRRVRHEWLVKTARLLIFDNAEDPKLVEEWRPTRGGCRVLVTSRRHRWGREVQRLPLATLPRPDSLRLLLGFRAHELGRSVEELVEQHRAEANRICELLDDLPLALHLAGKYLTNPAALTPATYLAELEGQPALKNEALIDWVQDYSPTRHLQNIAATFEISFKRLDPARPVDALARQLYKRCGLFAPFPIPRDLLLATLDLPDDTPARHPGDAVARLVELGLLELAGEAQSPRLHRLLAEFARHQTPAERRDEVADAVAEAVEGRINEVVNGGLPRALTPALREHLQFNLIRAEARKSLQTAGLYNALGRTLRNLQADYAGARTAHEKALALAEAALGPEHADVATYVNNLALVLQDLGDYEGAKGLLEKAMQSAEQNFGPDHPTTAVSYSNLATVLQDLGDLVGARAAYERALEIFEARLGPDHPNTKIVRGNLDRARAH